MSSQPGVNKKGKRVIGVVMMLFVLALGIGIGTLVTNRVGATGPGDSRLQIQTDGKPIGGALQAFSKAFEDVSNRVEPAVVNINTEVISSRGRFMVPEMEDEDDLMDLFRGLPFGGDPRRMPGVPRSAPEPQRGVGSGVIVDSKGYIITNNHVVANATKIKVSISGGEEYTAKLIGTDPVSDIAVIKINGNKPFPYAKVGDSKSMKVGDWVLAIGSPFGLERTVTAGIISATGRTFTNGDGPDGYSIFNDYLQTDASINPGNSGGPLVNMNGEVIGINSFISTSSRSSAGVGFAVPSHLFVNAYNQILETGKVARGWVGVSMNGFPFTPEMAEFFGVKQGSGVLITQLVGEDSKTSDAGPAAKAGLKVEDVVIAIDGAKINDNQDFRLAIANTPPGRTVKIKAVRYGVEKEFNVTVAERKFKESEKAKSAYSFDEDQKPRTEIGIDFDDVPARVAKALGISGGAYITSVKPGSLADEAGLSGPDPRGGADVIVAANGKPVNSRDDLYNLVKGLKSGSPIVLKFMREVMDESGNRVPSTSFTSIVKP